MSGGASSDALVLEVGAPDHQLALAAEMLATRDATVLFENSIALRATPTALVCEVIDPAPMTRRCTQEYEVLVENARRRLEASRLAGLLPGLPRRWVVVEDSGSGAVEVWSAR